MRHLKKYHIFEQDDNTEKLKNTTQEYNQYKNTVKDIVEQEDDQQSRKERFESEVIEQLSDESEAEDLLRTLFSAESMAKRIEELEQQKEEIDKEITERQEELNNMQQKLQQ